jgi:RNA polymerase sigma-70 factor (sigma-E family)
VNADDERRYVQFVSTRLPWLRKVAFLLCQDWDRADDLAQAAITRLYTHWRAAARATNLDGYARTVLVREFLGSRRTAWARRVDLRDEPYAEASSPAEDPATRLAVRAALAMVPPRQRAALVLRFYCDLSITEAAEALACSPGTVKSQTSRGLAALRRALDGHEITVEG